MVEAVFVSVDRAIASRNLTVMMANVAIAETAISTLFRSV